MIQTLRQRIIRVMESCVTHEQHKAAVRYARLGLRRLQRDIRDCDEYTVSWLRLEISAIEHRITTEKIRWMNGKKVEMLYS